MAHVILGLLTLADQSLYDLIKSFRSGVSLFYSASSGSIKRALDGLLASGFIEVASVEEGSRGRKVYRVTDAGRRDFHRWMEDELCGADAENEMLSRLYFLGLVEPSRRVLVVGQIRQRLESDLAEFMALDQHLDQQEVCEDLHDVATHQRHTLDYGIASHRFALSWLQDTYRTGGFEQGRV